MIICQSLNILYLSHHHYLRLAQINAKPQNRLNTSKDAAKYWI